MFAIDTIFENGRFQTMDTGRPYASKVGVYDGKIIAVDDEIEGMQAKHYVDLQGRYACPGFNDVHLHFSLLGANLNQVDLRKQTTSTIAELYCKIQEACAQAPEGEWVLGWGFDQFSLGAFPDRARLDEISAGHPVLVLHLSNHAAVINTEAFRRGGYEHPDDIDQPDLVIKEQGKATGLVKDKMCFMFNGLANRVSERTLLHQLELAAQYTLSYGITSFSDAGTGTDRNWEGIGQTPYDIGLFQAAYERGMIHQRGTLMPYFSALHDLGQLAGDISDGFGLDLGIRTGFGGDLLDIGPFKIILDGAFSSLSAYLNEPYLGSANNCGVFSWDPEDFIRQVAKLHRQGLRMAVHAIGDRAINIALDAIENAQRLYPRHDVRHRLEHCGLADDATVGRVIRDGVIPNPQGSFMYNNGDAYVRLLGEERADRTYRMGSFVHHGAIIPGSTDAPCAPLAPMISIEGMVTRATESGYVLGTNEQLTLDEALYAYTFGSAYASHKEQVLGTIERGKYADFTVLDTDPHDVPPEALHEVTVAQTIIGGEVQYDHDSH
ncbi:MAG: amidohydrolase [Bifidobacterium tibiigranuli]|jgi:predicted amidohydrolase YtcJ|nr:amidohydrolase [Bifidobacterium tibiigranuli]